MAFTLLLDLDDTLLSNDIDLFIKGYLKELSIAFAPLVAPEKMLPAMQKAIQAMLQKQFPGGTLENTFDRVFYREIGIDKNHFLDTIAYFYREIYPRLQPITAPRPAAIDLVHRAISRGWTVVVATNPLFPATAIHQRLAWAGLPVERVPFTLVTTYENSHFCKPNSAYYAEILARLRWPEGPVAMVGNSLSDDIRPTEALGIPTYWLHESDEGNIPFERQPISQTGSLEQLWAWLEDFATRTEGPHYTSTAALLATLQSTPAALSDLSTNLPAQAWNHRPAPEEWSYTEILCHLRDVDLEVNYDRIKNVLSGANPFIPAVSTDPWVEERKYLSEDGPVALVGFTDARASLLNLLLNMENGAWQEPARHTIFGPTTLQELVEFIATHDRTHINQAWQALLVAQSQAAD